MTLAPPVNEPPDLKLGKQNGKEDAGKCVTASPAKKARVVFTQQAFLEGIAKIQEAQQERQHAFQVSFIECTNTCECVVFDMS